MVVLAASIISKGGKPLLSRQFRPLPLSRLSALLTSFPTLLPTSSTASQHTTLTSPLHPHIRYVYLPLEDLYLILIVNTQSNILLDIETLQLFSRVVGEVCGGRVSEAEVGRCAFELLSAMDEIVSMGYREKLDLMAVKNILEMESHEEKIQEIITRNREAEAKEELRRRAKQLELQRREAQRRGQPNPYTNVPMSMPSLPTPSFTNRAHRPPRRTSRLRRPTSRSKGKECSLGGGAKKANLKADAVLAEAMDGLGVDESVLRSYTPEPVRSASPAVPAQAAVAAPENPFPDVEQQDVHLNLKEKLSLSLSRDGGVTSFELLGELNLHVNDATANKCYAKVRHNDQFQSSELQFKVHPNVDRNAWSKENRIALKDAKRTFPVGQDVGVLKWRLAGKDETWVPLSINCWPTVSNSGTTEVSIEYELENTSLSLHNVTISIPLPPGSYPTVSESSSETCNGTWSVNADAHSLDWIVPIISTEGEGTNSGSLEFTCPGDDVAYFFPVAVDFVSQQGICGVEIVEVKSGETQEDIPFSLQGLLTTDEYVVV
ncbi:hypothetical protein BT69DRAFT_1353967 [Atractiella rhizophila]|nr:hypothetical protein BT69DRAFT_1353967 [Atractiella rhizophila]